MIPIRPAVDSSALTQDPARDPINEGRAAGREPPSSLQQGERSKLEFVPKLKTTEKARLRLGQRLARVAHKSFLSRAGPSSRRSGQCNGAP
jgi:hypothetical protein